MRDRRAHWLKPLKRGGIPSSHMVIDTEASIERYAGRYEHRWLCGHMVHVANTDDAPFRLVSSTPYDTPGALWADICGTAERRGGLVVWAHNLPYDLRVSNALRELLAHGWQCDSISLARVSAWSSWRKDNMKITVCDSYAWLHVPLARLAKEMGRPFPSVDISKLSPGDFAERCERDANLLADAVCSILNMLDAEQLGPFRPTGAGQSHAAWRRRFLVEKRVLVHDDHEALAVERFAMHTGRCEAWRWGDVTGTLYEHDLHLAYCRIAAENALPTKLIGEVGPNVAHAVVHGDSELAVMAEVDVKTDLPLVPLQRDGRVLWPVGEFTTTLWDSELWLLDHHSAEWTVKRAWAYQRSDALAPMSRWLVEQLALPESEHTAAQRRVLKHWARTLVGRCALRYSQWEHFGRSPWDCLELSFEITPDLKDAVAHLQVGHTTFERTAEREANNSCPAIPGWVQSRARVILWQLVMRAGFENVAYMDTDGLLVTLEGDRNLGRFNPYGDDWVLAYKGAHRFVTIHGPRQVEIGPERRIAGLPKNAIRVSEITWDGEMWEGLEQALAAGHHDHVGVVPSTWQITPTDHRREHLPDGLTAPWRV